MWVLYEVYDMTKPEPLDLEDNPYPEDIFPETYFQK